MKKFLIILLCMMFVGSAAADKVYVMCQPDSFVYVRKFAKTSAQVAGMVELGDELETDGKKKNGFLHVTGFEDGGWIYAGFVTEYTITIFTARAQIQSSGRVACRRSMRGTRRRWLKDGQNVTVYAFADDWAITNQGFIQTQYLGGL